MLAVRELQTSARSLSELLDENDVFDALIEAQGNTALAADKLCTKYGLDRTTQLREVRNHIPTMIVARLPELKQHMEAISTLELFELLPQLRKTLVENLSNLSATDAVNAYMKLMDLITKKTDPHELNINVNDQRWKNIPRSLQELYAKLEASGQLAQVIEHDSADSVSGLAAQRNT